MEFGGIERRRAKRITHHYVIRFRQIKPPIASEHWDLTTVKDISKTGISFYASHHYELGVELEIKMKNPLLQKETTCWVTVVRCHSSELKKGFYEAAMLKHCTLTSENNIF